MTCKLEPTLASAISSEFWTFLEERPTVKPGESRSSKAINFTTILADERWEPSDDLCATNTHLKMELMTDMGREKTPLAEKMLIIIAPKGMQFQTMAYF